MKKRLVKFQIILFCLCLTSVSSVFCQDRTGPDAWENRHNKLQPPEKVMDAIGLKPGMVIGEIGAGRGRYAVSLAERVGEKGKVYANDINERDLDYLKRRCKRDNINNIETILGGEIEPRFPEKSLDIAFVINTYHHLDKPVELLKNVIPALKSGGTLAIVEHEPDKSGFSLESSTKNETLIRQATNAGFKLARIETFLERDNIYIFTVK
ncbi:class I SAM-dependent methyltransferase [candidate division KSB1 bacterium]